MYVFHSPDFIFCCLWMLLRRRRYRCYVVMKLFHHHHVLLVDIFIYVVCHRQWLAFRLPSSTIRHLLISFWYMCLFHFCECVCAGLVRFSRTNGSKTNTRSSMFCFWQFSWHRIFCTTQSDGVRENDCISCVCIRASNAHTFTSGRLYWPHTSSYRRSCEIKAHTR